MYSKYTFSSIFDGIPAQTYYTKGSVLGSASITIHANGTTYAGKWEVLDDLRETSIGAKLRVSETKLNNVLLDLSKVITNTYVTPASGNTLEVHEGTSTGWASITNKAANVTAGMISDGSGTTNKAYGYCSHFYTNDGTKHWYQLSGMTSYYAGSTGLGSGHVYMGSDYLYNIPFAPSTGVSSTLTGIKTYYFSSNNFANPIYLELKFVFDASATNPYSIRLTPYRYINGTATTLTSAASRDAYYRYNINVGGDIDAASAFPQDINDPVDNPGTIIISSSKYHLMMMGRTNISTPSYSGYLISSFYNNNDWLKTFNNSASNTTRIPTWCEVPINTNGVYLPMDVYSAAKVSALKVNTTIGTSAITVATGGNAKYQLYTLSGLSKTQAETVAYGPTSDDLLLFRLNVVDANTGLMGDISELSKAYLMVGSIPEDETEITVDGETYVTFQNICILKG